MNHDLQPAVEWTFSVLAGALLDGDHSTPVQAETSAIIKSWSEAAKILVVSVAGHAARSQHTLLRRRPDWPAVGIEFEELTKERKKQYGVKDGDVVATVDGEKLKEPARLARAIYERGPGGTLALGVVRGGANRAVSLVAPP